ncbi:hemin uptake protein HemP [Rhizomicrobium palustre]|jgi:hemin uptake protein HemP|uniref:Hemin uptake protein HemP n=1 Tax=Rhizomicrobium palustre TaxID=189966 RepID=A0A846N108_9PROT|nr:hemin uptake protein HemP [Rhizomicrobium palustre]NIK89644.1 hemin uptake protein HemP [Rhizomicrobium palustre]
MNQAPLPRTKPEPPRLSAQMVLKGAREVILVHGREEYRLKLTAAGKLILTK